MENDGFLVTFKYIDNDLKTEDNFTAICQAVPRIGEIVFGPKKSGGGMVVRQVGYRFRKEADDEFFVQSIHVLLDLVSEGLAPEEA